MIARDKKKDKVTKVIHDVESRKAASVYQQDRESVVFQEWF